MAFDINKLSGGSPPGGGKIIEPRKIFSTLVRNPRFRRPSDEQGEVLDAWFEKRNRSDNTLKMNTGSGKTLVGLLALQSSLNEGAGPAVYVTPDNYLASQVIQEAKDLGISTTENPLDSAYLSGKAILVINVYKLINGKSVFGVGAEGKKLPIGSLIFDDAHACLSVVNEQFTLKIPNEHPAYSQLLKLFEDDLRTQSETGLLDVKANDPQAIVPVPFWAWKNKQTDAIKILHQHRDDNGFAFVWPLLKEVCPLCLCVFGGRGLEIAPRCLPIDEIASFVSAKRKIYMTATLADDGVLISHFQADPDCVTSPIKPKGAGEIGDRMILAPQEINPSLTFDEVKKLVVDISKTHNVVVIVPSGRRALVWSDVASQTLNAANIESGVSKLKAGQQGITVLVNKYDGVDLPGDACRLLVIDGLPEVFGLIERVEMASLDGTDIQLARQMQKLEQGMGRGVRSGEDHCAVLLLGSRLTQKIHMPSARSKFSPATLAQLDLSREVAEQLQGASSKQLRPVLDYCLTKNPDWWRKGKERLANAPEGLGGFVDTNVIAIRKAFDAARAQRIDQACKLIQEQIRSAKEKTVRGYLKQQLAEYTHHLDPKEAQEIVLSGYQDNRRILKPLSGITYARLAAPHGSQAAAAAEFMKRFLDGNDLIIFTNALLDDLDWYEDDAKRFEAAIRELGAFLGFGSQRPEVDLGKGPDNLWAVGTLNFFVIEAKNGATTAQISKSDWTQLVGSMEWFEASYDSTCKASPVIIHPSAKFDRYSSPSAHIKIIDQPSLTKLKNAIAAYAKAIASAKAMTDPPKIKEQLEAFKLTASLFLNTFAKGPSK